MQLVRRQFLSFAGSALITSTLPSMAKAQPTRRALFA
jgi:hypothetical protein